MAAGDDWKAYRLLQLALIYVFTLRNALRVPEAAAQHWATRTDRIVSEIRILKERLAQEQARRYLRLPLVEPNLRLERLRIAVVSICAYPTEHPLVLRNLTPGNRQAYGERQGYDVFVHYEHPMPEQGVHIQHSKLQLVADYLRKGYDWVAWLDCDSIITNLDRSLDSIIYRYARREARMPEEMADSLDLAEQEEPMEMLQEPLEDETLETFVGHLGSCNSDEGCYLSTSIRVNPKVRYVSTLRVAQIDMEQDSERISNINLGGRELGDCNPQPESDFDCRLHNCFREVEVPIEAVASGRVFLEARAARSRGYASASRSC